MINGIFGGILRGSGVSGGGMMRHLVTSLTAPENLVYLAVIAALMVIVIALAGLTIREYYLLKKK